MTGGGKYGLRIYQGGRDNSLGLVTVLLAGHTRNYGSIPGKGKRFYFSRAVEGTSYLLFFGYRGAFSTGFNAIRA
jgi:hypothetical protein